MIHVLATIRVRAAGREAFLQEFKKLVPLVLKEKGCIEYLAAVDTPTTLPTQTPLRDDVVMVIEKWEDTEALADHLIAPHMNNYRAQVKHLVESIDLQVLEPA